MRVPTKTWKLVETRWERGDNIILVRPGAAHAVCAFFNGGVHVGWYVNLQEPLRRTNLGFDYMDLALDIVVAADCTAWQWKDEDEIVEWVPRGYISEGDASEVRAEGERVITDIRARSGFFSEGWARWRPDPAWHLPELPQAWNLL